MNIFIPPTTDVKRSLNRLGHAELLQLSEASQVPMTTLYRIRYGETPNPGIETVRAFYPELCILIEKKQKLND